MHKLKYIHLLWVMLFLSKVSFAQITANFTSNESIGCDALIVQFENTSTGATDISYQWDFGNGTTSTIANPQVVFNTTGKYTITLIASNDQFADTRIKSDFIIINQSPVISQITANDPINCVPLTTSFEAVIDTSQSTIESYFWDFGDANSSIEPTPSHTYINGDDYSVSLFVTDNNNCEGVFTASKLIQAIAKPVLGFTSSTNIACVDSLMVSFSNTSYGATPLSFQWDFGNDSTSAEDSPSSLYSGFNEYTVGLIATDTFTCTSTLIKSNYVKMQALTLNTTILDSFLCKKEVLQVSNETVGANKHFWDFGDGTTSSASVPEKSFLDTGQFVITYIASLDNYCSDTLIAEVSVDKLTAQFSTDHQYGCQFPFVVQYSNSSVGADNYLWKFGNATQSSRESPSVAYAKTLTLKEQRNMYFSDTLIVESSVACRDTFVVENNVHLYLPEVYFTPNETSIDSTVFKGCVPIAVNFENKSISYNDEDPFVNVLWDFGDSNTSTENDPSHSFTNIGDYPVKLSLTNESGCVNSYTSTLLAGDVQDALFSYSGNETICGSELVQFNNLSSNDSLINAWEWEFSENSKFDNKNPEVQFKDTGFISGELTVFYNGCKGTTYELDSFIYVDGPAGDVLVSLDCKEPLDFNFSLDVYDADRWTYNFGDGVSGSEMDPLVSHKYAESGNYLFYLEAHSEECSLELEQNIFVRQLKADFAVEPEGICPGTEVTFNPRNTIGNSVFVYDNTLVRYLWDYGDTIVDYSLDSSTHIYTEPGNYTVNMLVKDINSCQQNLQKEVKVFNVESDFNYSDSIGCAPVSVVFSDKSISDTTIASWSWNFGNGETSTLQNPDISFDEDKKHSISLIIFDVYGCTDTLIKENAIFSSSPIADFQLLQTKTCFNDSLQFDNLSQGEWLNAYEWTFGSGIVSSEISPIIILPDTGYFDVSLWVSDSIGCDTQVTKPNYVYVQSNPTAEFTLDTSSSKCYPKVIGFNDISPSSEITNRYWEFGDGEVNNDSEAPFHTYNRSGIFDVSLKVSTSFGCYHVLTKEDVVDIGGPYVDIITPDTLCVNTPISVAFKNPVNIYSFKWSVEEGSTYTTNPFSESYTSFGTKKVYLYLESDSLGTCSKLLLDSIQIPELTADFSLIDPALCTPFSSSVINKTIHGNRFKWYVDGVFESEQVEPVINIQEHGLYDIKLLAESITACRDSMTKRATVYSLPQVDLNNDTLICQYDSIWLQANDGINYAWYYQDQLFDSLVSSVLVKPLETSSYHVKVTDINACVNTDSTQVSVMPKPQVSVITPDSLIIIGEQIELHAVHEYADEITWEPMDEVSCVNCVSTYVQPLQSTIFYFEATDNLGCFSVVDSVNVRVDAKYSLDVPSSFTPNGDGINDVLYVMGWGIKEMLGITIHDLNGRVVFKSNDRNEGWDGNSPLGVQQEGMYLYNVEVLSFDNEQRSKQGYIYLIR